MWSVVLLANARIRAVVLTESLTVVRKVCQLFLNRYPTTPLNCKFTSFFLTKQIIWLCEYYLYILYFSRLEQNFITELPPKSFSNFRRLRRIDLSNNNISRVAHDAFNGLKSLTTL